MLEILLIQSILTLTSKTKFCFHDYIVIVDSNYINTSKKLTQHYCKKFVSSSYIKRQLTQSCPLRRWRPMKGLSGKFLPMKSSTSFTTLSANCKYCWRARCSRATGNAAGDPRRARTGWSLAGNLPKHNSYHDYICATTAVKTKWPMQLTT